MNDLSHIQTSRNSFLVVSTPIFATRDSLENSRRDVQDYLLLHRSDLKQSPTNRRTLYTLKMKCQKPNDIDFAWNLPRLCSF